jgi:class 3 adenylate cyclase/tetratricopeptide (TPR) repeat protein
VDELESIDAAIAALEAQRELLSNEVVDTAVEPLREKRLAILARDADEQRRLVTILFSDVVDFTVLSQALDAEDVRTVMNTYFTRWHEHIVANGGVVEKFIGDAVMAVFGLYQAKEDDPHRAIRAALAMVADFEELNDEIERQHGVRIAMRVGIDTGEVVVAGLGDRPGHEFVVVGETANRASRLQAAAPPGAVLVSKDTHRHVRGSFGFEPLEGLRLKGFSNPVDAFVVLAERPRGFELDAARGIEGIDTNTVGRDAELHRLQDHFWDVSEERHWRVVTIVGDAGVGKSRLLLEFDTWLAELPQPVWWFRGRASPVGEASPNFVLRDVLATRLDIQESDDPATVRAKWEAGIEAALGAGAESQSHAHVIARYLGFEIGDPPAVAALRHDPEALRNRALTYLADYFRRLAEEAVVVLLVEDLHWADETSLATVDAADAALHDSPVLVIATARPSLLDRHPRWGEGHSYHTRFDLDPLSRRASRRLVADILHRVDDLPSKLVDLVVEAAEGNPFYMEELVAFLLEAGVITADGDRWEVQDADLDRARVPDTLRGVLQARIDALTPPERHALQRASVVGRVFWDDAVANLARDADEEPLPAQTVLDQLRTRQVVFERERSSFDDTREFLFKHAILRDVTYESVLRSRRQRYHALAAAWLEAVTERSGRADEYAAAIANHHAAAGDAAAAASWYRRAGERAAAVHALADAERLLTHGFDIAPADDWALRFDLLLARETVHHFLGNRDADLADFAALDELDTQLRDPTRHVLLQLARCRQLFHSSEYDTQIATAMATVEEAGAAGLPERQVEAQLWLGQGYAWRGDHDDANRVLKGALVGARATHQSRLEAETLRYLAIVANNRSEFDSAVALLEEAWEATRRSGDEEGETYVLVQQATVFFNLGRFRDARERLVLAIPRFEASGYRYRLAIGLSNLATTIVMQGELGEGRRVIEQGLEMCRQIDDKEGIGNALNVLGEAYRRAGDWANAEAHLRESLDLAIAISQAYLASDSAAALGLIAAERGQVEDALRLLDEADELAERAESELASARSLCTRGRVLLDAAQPAAAAVALRRAAGLAIELGVGILAVESRSLLAKALWDAGERDEALTLARDVIPSLLPEHLEGAIDGAAALLACLAVLDGANDDGAASVAAAARGYLTEFSNRIGDDVLREGFVHHVPSNVQLAARTNWSDAVPTGG